MMLKRFSYFHPYRLGKILEDKLKTPQFQMTQRLGNMLLYDPSGKPVYKKVWFLASSFFIIYHAFSHPFLVSGAIGMGIIFGRPIVKRSLLEYRLNSDLKVFFNEIVFNGDKLNIVGSSSEVHSLKRVINILRSSVGGASSSSKSQYRWSVEDYRVISDSSLSFSTYVKTPIDDLYKISGVSGQEEAELVINLISKATNSTVLSFDCIISHPHMLLRLMPMGIKPLISSPIISQIRVRVEMGDRIIHFRVPPDLFDDIIRSAVYEANERGDSANNIPDAEFKEKSKRN